MQNPIEVSRTRYRADEDYIYAVDPVARFDQRRLASMVGYVAIGLPIVLGIGGLMLGGLTHGGSPLGSFRASISGFYYESVLLGDVMVGALAFIGTLMLAYRGWSRKVADLATGAGLAAYLVALFPAAGWFLVSGEDAIFVTASHILHAVAAGVLFLILAFFCFFVFTRVEVHQTEGEGVPASVKRARDRIYRAAGTLILLSIAAIPLGGLLLEDRADTYRITFWAETVALTAFGISWLVQGRASNTRLMDVRDRRDKAVAKGKEAAAEAKD